MELSSLLLLTAVAGYGDPVDSYPSASERWLHLWTNAARVAPDEFEEDYKTGGCSFDDFSEDEQTPKAPLYIDLGLTEASRYHSEDMAENGCFQHESCDGTDTWTRIARYYSDSSYLGENIAMAMNDARFAVVSMWMCSTSGHRANIMNGDYNELGPGAATASSGYNYYTQDFAQGSLVDGDPPMRMGADDGAGTFYADWGDEAAPASLSVVIEGEATAMDLAHGTDVQGIYSASAEAASGDRYWFVWETAGGETGTFPASGAWLYGTDDWEPMESDELLGGGSDNISGDGVIRLVGCNSASRVGPMSWTWLAIGGLGLLLRRR